MPLILTPPESSEDKVDFELLKQFLNFLRNEKELMLYQTILHNFKPTCFIDNRCTYLVDSNLSQKNLLTWLSNWKNNPWKINQITQISEKEEQVITFAEYLRLQQEKQKTYVENHPMVKKIMNLFAGSKLDDIVTNIN